MDWERWARRAEAALAFDEREVSWRDLFAPGATFGDPSTAPTGDLRSVQSATAAVFPDWRQQITTSRGGQDWAVFEWVGRATYAGRRPGDPAAGARVEMHGATIVEVDARGMVTSWRDYLDRKEPEDQLRAHGRGGATAEGTSSGPAPEGRRRR
jgi:hypothetical protein